MKDSIKIVAAFLLLTGSVSCKKFVQAPPPVTSLVTSTVFSTNATAASAVSGIYEIMAGDCVAGGTYGISALLGLSADEFTLYPNAGETLNQVYTNSLVPVNNNPIPEWSTLYNCIYQANTVIEALSVSSGVTAAMKQQLTGEAEFIRAFCNFYLVNIYGNVPLVNTTDYKINGVITNTPQATTYQQMVTDLKDAQTLLSDNFLAPDGSTSSERVRPNKGAATALLARVYLYQRQWSNATTQATTVINNTNYQLLSNLNNVFLANSNEAIWQLELPNYGSNTPDAAAFLLSYYGGPNSYEASFILSNSLVNTFESGDLRRADWVDSIIVSGTTYYFPFKYKLNYTGEPPVEYPMLLRLAEQYLIRGEARAEQGDISGAQADLNVIRTRAGLPNTTASTQTDLLTAIQHERRVEFFTEYGHRWLDLKRTNTVDSIMSNVTPMKGGVWKTTDQLYPIQQYDIQSDPNLKQNPGYQ